MSSNWIADEESVEIDDLSEVFPDAPTNDEDEADLIEATSTPLPYLDPEVAEEMISSGPPTWFGVRWRDIPATEQAEAWNGLRVWVDWLVYEYRLPTAVVPPCWYKHPNITAELYAAMCMEYKVWEEQEPGLSPMMFWHPNLLHMTARLREAVTTAGCVTNGRHKEPLAVDGREPFELDYDETDWQQHVTTSTTTQQFDRPNQGVLYVRAGIVDGKGEIVAQSGPVGIKRANVSQEAAVHIEYLSTNNSYSALAARWEHYREDHNLIWETSSDGQTWEIYKEGDEHDAQ